MHRTLYIVIVVLFFFSCKDKEINNSVATKCYPELKDIKRGERLVDFPVTVRLSGGLISGAILVDDKNHRLGACNLPGEFLKDSLAIYVSGYGLTSPTLISISMSQAPFEVTSAKLR